MQDDNLQNQTTTSQQDQGDDFTITSEEKHLDDMYDLSTALEDYADAEEEETNKLKEEIKSLQQTDSD